VNSFTIRDIENLCGIKAHTLRAWEQRYNFFCPKRRAGNHRSYDKEDLKYLLRIAYLYHNGHKISVLARLTEKEICQLTIEHYSTEGASEICINQLTEASLDFDQDRFDKILQHIILNQGFEKAISKVAFAFLNKMGLLWLTGNVVPAQEHFASALITKKIHVAIDGLEAPPPGADRKILIYAPKGEFHEIPLLYMHYLMKKNGIPTIYFGKDVGIEELEYYCAYKPVTHLYFNLVTNLARFEPHQYIEKLVSLFPDKEIVISGCLARDLQHVRPGVRPLRSMEEMHAFAGER
jgi:MerR family transcriptional regulator, light-induced transcriptional regulator